MTTRILIVDDHEIVREGLISHLAESRPDWEICGEATDGEQAIQFARDLRPDILILDITMPRMSGFEASSRMRQLGLTVPVLIFTTHDSERLEAEVRQAGAQGYVLKSQAVRHLIHAIDTILAGGTFFGAPPKPEPAAGGSPIPGIVFFRGLGLSSCNVFGSVAFDHL
jgi:DNA-binding NarL/FixJ family response regulator